MVIKKEHRKCVENRTKYLWPMIMFPLFKLPSFEDYYYYPSMQHTYHLLFACEWEAVKLKHQDTPSTHTCEYTSKPLPCTGKKHRHSHTHPHTMGYCVPWPLSSSSTILPHLMATFVSLRNTSFIGYSNAPLCPLLCHRTRLPFFFLLLLFF